MEKQAIEMIINLVAQGIGVTGELVTLARRVRAGDPPTVEEILNAQNRMEAAAREWDGAADGDRPNA